MSTSRKKKAARANPKSTTSVETLSKEKAKAEAEKVCATYHAGLHPLEVRRLVYTTNRKTGHGPAIRKEIRALGTDTSRAIEHALKLYSEFRGSGTSPTADLAEFKKARKSNDKLTYSAWIENKDAEKTPVVAPAPIPTPKAAPVKRKPSRKETWPHRHAAFLERQRLIQLGHLPSRKAMKAWSREGRRCRRNGLETPTPPWEIKRQHDALYDEAAERLLQGVA